VNDIPTALITGVCGFCARHLVRMLSGEGRVRIVGADLLAAPPADLELADYRAADLARSDEAAALIRQVRPDMVFHLAGRSRGTSDELYGANLLAGVHLLEAVRESSPQARVLVVGTAAEYGPAPPEEMPIAEDHLCRPRGAYGLSKHALSLAALDYALHRGLKVVVARPFNIIGAGVPPSLVVGAVLDRAKRALAESDSPVVTVGNVDATRDFLAVEDVARVYVQMIRGDYWGEVFNVCSGIPYRIRDVVESLLSHSLRPIEYRVDPHLLKPDDVAVFVGSCEKARRTFGFAPTVAVEESLKSAWQHVMGPVKSCEFCS
jgi:GDP-4-dehydro-6-deoxy-D-mannose reductase